MEARWRSGILLAVALLGCAVLGGLAWAWRLQDDSLSAMSRFWAGASLVGVLFGLYLVCTAIPLHAVDRLLMKQGAGLSRAFQAAAGAQVPLGVILAGVCFYEGVGHPLPAATLFGLLIFCLKGIAPLTLYFTYARTYRRGSVDAAMVVSSVWLSLIGLATLARMV